MSPPVKAPKKLIEVALPLDRINEAAAKEKSIRHGHPSTLHLWWARRPLAAARAVKVGEPKDGTDAKTGTKLSRGASFRCLMSGTPIGGDHIKAEGRAGRMGARMMAIVAEGTRGRVYLEPTPEHEAVASQPAPQWQPEGTLVEDARAFTPTLYGLVRWRDLFTSRQLVALTTFSDLVSAAREGVRCAAEALGFPKDPRGVDDDGVGATAYADAVATYLAFAVDRTIDRHTTIATWDSSPTKLQLRNTFARQAIPMTWDFAEGNPFCDSSGALAPSVDWVALAVSALVPSPRGVALQMAADDETMSRGQIVSTDPPYYDNVPYADLSDFFYVWLRRCLKPAFPNLFATLAVRGLSHLLTASSRPSKRVQ